MPATACAHAMRVLVTGPLNPVGAAVARALAAAGHTVRAFGVPAGEDPFHDPRIECYPGDVATGGSIEPVAVECQALVHASGLDAVGKDKLAHAVKLERGTLYARFGAERELVGRFVVLLPESPGSAFSDAVDAAEAAAKGTKSLVPTTVLRASDRDPEAAAKQVLGVLGKATPVTASA